MSYHRQIKNRLEKQAPLFLSRGKWQIAGSLLVAVSITISSALTLTSSAASGSTQTTSGSSKQTTSRSQAWPKRDFLPPVAMINDRLEAGRKSDLSLETIDLQGTSGQTFKTHAQVTRLDSDIPIEGKVSSTGQGGVQELRRKVEEADLEYLWQATVQKNPVIRFSLEKISTPTDLQPRHSSKFLTKTLSTMISGATMAATMMPGGGAYQNMTAIATGNALQNMVGNKPGYQGNSLTPTEQIQLAGLIDSLKLSLIRNYEDYQTSLHSLGQSRETTVKNSNIYTQALASKNDMAIMAAGSAYYQAMIRESELRRKAQLQRLTLERIAGREAVDKLVLAPRLSDPMAGTIANKTESTSPSEQMASVSTVSGALALPIGPEEPIIGPEAPEAGSKKTTVFKKRPPEPAKTPSTVTTAKQQTSKSSTSIATTTPRNAFRHEDTPPQVMMEIGPSLPSEYQERYLPLPASKNGKPVAKTTPANKPKIAGKNAGTPFSLPLIPDRILDHSGEVPINAP